jgi:hypothetical protein
MPGSSRRQGHTPTPARSAALEVATISADELRANLLVTGPVSDRAVPLLETVLCTHLRAGRRQLHVDLGAATLSDAAIHCLAESADAAAALGGALVVANAPQPAARAIALLRRTPAHA